MPGSWTFTELDLAGRQQIDQQGDIVGFETIAVSTAALGLTPPSIALSALVQVLTDNVRMIIAGVDPTATLGHRLVAGDAITLKGPKTLRGARFIREGAADATLNVHYFD